MLTGRVRGLDLIMREILDIVQILRENHGIPQCHVVIVQNTRKTRLCDETENVEKGDVVIRHISKATFFRKKTDVNRLV